MIEFVGSLSDECKKKELKRETKTKLIIFSFLAILFSIPVIIISIVFDWLCIIMLPAVLFGTLAGAIPPPKKAYGLIFPDRVYLDGESIESKGERFCHYRSLIDVKKVIDCGEYYRIIFFFPYKNQTFICQKDLIIKGTLEDFEKLFEGKIVKE